MHNAVVEYLIRHKADVMAKDRFGTSVCAAALQPAAAFFFLHNAAPSGVVGVLWGTHVHTHVHMFTCMLDVCVRMPLRVCVFNSGSYSGKYERVVFCLFVYYLQFVKLII